MTLDQVMLGWPELRDATIVQDERIREKEFGLAAVYNDWRIFFTRFPDYALAWAHDGEYAFRYPSGENAYDVKQRYRDHQETLLRRNPGQRVLEISHHLVIMSVIALQRRLTEEQFLTFNVEQRPINCGLTTFRGKEDDSLELSAYNQKLYECEHDSNA